jgi:hypothetical protein
MKKLILTILASTLILSCSNNSDNIDSTTTGPLIKSETSIGGTATFNYNGNKLSNIVYSPSESVNYTYNGDLIIKEENNGNGRVNSTTNYNYVNNLLSSISSIESATNISNTSNSTYTYNSDGSITVMSTRTTINLGITQINNSKHIRYYSQGNCIKDESFSISNGVSTLVSTITFTYDTSNSPYKNIKGFYSLANPQGFYGLNNLKSETHKNANNKTTRTVQITYQYNSQNYPISSTGVITNYTINSQTGVSTPQTPITQSTTINYY